MKGKAVSGTLLTLLLIGMLTLAFNIQSVKSDWTWTETIYIRADGSIYPVTAPVSSVDNVTYTLTDNIVGYVPEGSSAIVVERDNIVVDGATYTVQGMGARWCTGISLSGRSNVTIKKMEINLFYWGIYLYYSSNSSISGNTIANNQYGIDLYRSSNNSISGNNITANNRYGTILSYSSNSSISGNNITANNQYGIFLGASSNSSISGNTIANNQYGVYLSSSNNNILRYISMANNEYNFGIWSRRLSDFANDVDTSNTVDGKPIYYWINKRDMAVPPGAGYVALVSCTRITVQNLNLTNNYQGILLASTTNSTIVGNTIANNQFGIELYRSSNNSISGNNITANNESGIGLFWSCNYNSISGNTIANNQYGIDLYRSSNSSISGNNVTANNWSGVYVWESSYNKFYHNNFIDNTRQVYIRVSGYANFWDDGYPSGGNYWSDHITVDDYSGVYQNELGRDGIVDEPYIIDLYNRDNYPFVEPWSPKPPTPIEALKELIETIKSWNLPKGTENCLTKKLYDAISLLEMGNLNGATHKLGDFINQVENDRKDLTEEQRSELIFRAQRIIDLIKG